jgi:hypothetical protein
VNNKNESSPYKRRRLTSGEVAVTVWGMLAIALVLWILTAIFGVTGHSTTALVLFIAGVVALIGDAIFFYWPSDGG